MGITAEMKIQEIVSRINASPHYRAITGYESQSLIRAAATGDRLHFWVRVGPRGGLTLWTDRSDESCAAKGKDALLALSINLQ